MRRSHDILEAVHPPVSEVQQSYSKAAVRSRSREMPGGQTPAVKRAVAKWHTLASARTSKTVVKHKWSNMSGQTSVAKRKWQNGTRWPPGASPRGTRPRTRTRRPTRTRQTRAALRDAHTGLRKHAIAHSRARETERGCARVQAQTVGDPSRPRDARATHAHARTSTPVHAFYTQRHTSLSNV